jgi:hypothetical protein
MSFFSQPSVQRRPVILTGSSTWDAWYALVKNMATVQGIRQYVNPDIPTDMLPRLEEPVPPVLPEMVNNPENPIDLYWLQYQVYQMSTDRYKAVQHFMLRIQELLSMDVLSQTLCSDTAHAMLMVLKD